MERTFSYFPDILICQASVKRVDNTCISRIIVDLKGH